VSLELWQLDPLHRAAAEGRAVRVVAPIGDGADVERAAGEARLQRRVERGGGLAVPGADVLADVAAVEPVADLRLECGVDVGAVLDGQVGDAPPRVELVRRGDRAGR